MRKIKIKTPLVEIDGDEMTRVMWKMVKEHLLIPYLDLNVDYYDLGIENRDKTGDRVTVEAAEAIKKYAVGVKCATITPTGERVKEYGLKRAWPSPNGTIRSILDGTVFRAPILAGNIKPFVSRWEKPIIIGRHAYGDVYDARELRISEPGTAELHFQYSSGRKTERIKLFDFTGPGIVQSIHNYDESIISFARSCFRYGLENGMDVWFSTKDTISKIYDSNFREVFEREFRSNWKREYDQNGIKYFFTLIDDAVARIIRSEGGILWALKNYDGDVMSDMVAAGFGSLAMMTSVLVSPQGHYEYEAAHGTVQKHYYRHLKGEETSTNSMALIFAWTGSLKKRGELDGNPQLCEFAGVLERAAVETIESGIMTGDLIQIARPDRRNTKVTTEEFIKAVSSALRKKLK